MSTSIFENAIRNEPNKEELVKALNDMNRYVHKIESSNAPKDVITTWNTFVKSITQTIPQYIKQHTLNTVPHAVSYLSEMKNRQDIIDGKLSMTQAVTRAGGWDSPSFLSARLIDIAVELGARINSRDCGFSLTSLGVPALHYSALQNNYNCANVIMRHSKNTNFESKDRLYPIHYAFINEKNQVIRENTPNADILKEYIKASSKKLRKMIIDKTEDMNITSGKGETALHFASLHLVNDADSLNQMFKKGALSDLQDQKGNSPMHAAAQSGNNWMIDRLKKSNAPINALNTEGRTPLHVAALNKRPDSFKLLLNLGADITTKDNFGNTADQYLQTLENHNINRKPLRILENRNPNNLAMRL